MEIATKSFRMGELGKDILYHMFVQVGKAGYCFGGGGSNLAR
jgi:hypothetical protein